MTVVSEQLIEKLAAAEHASWSRWMNYLFSKCSQTPGGHLTIPAGLVQHWERQIDTPYADLSESEKQMDRDEVAHILPFIEAELDAERQRARE